MRPIFVLAIVLLTACQTPKTRPSSPFASGPQKLLDAHAGEGPAYAPEWGLLFSGGGNISRYEGAGESQVFREKAGSNGLLFDGQGRLIICEPVQRRVTRLDAEDRLTVLTDEYEGKRYNQPNDLTLDSQGRIYFTDPRYGDREGMEQRDPEGRAIEGVYRIDPDGGVSRIITHEVDRPNGLFITPDDRFIYIADNNNNNVGGARQLWKFRLLHDGTVDIDSQELIYDWKSGRGPDGMARDHAGFLYVAGGRTQANPPAETADPFLGGIYVFSPEDELIDFVAIPHDEVTNCAFGGRDSRDLFITAGGTLWTIRTHAPGFQSWDR